MGSLIEFQSAQGNLAFLGPQCGTESKWLHKPCLLKFSKTEGNESGYITLAFLGSQIFRMSSPDGTLLL